ncbi:amidase family protein, partial [Escherichia coli]|uniref:amidase family protein n=1 Tax=Escherichia coli TaxID=562 RepID=UPI003CE4CD6D
GCRMSLSHLTRRSASALAEAIRRREVSSEEVVRAHVERIDQVNPSVNAIVSYRPEEAIDRARELDALTCRGLSMGPLHGLPFAV